jgi:hypothetical protein
MANKGDDEDWGYCGCLVGLVMFCAMCYGIYYWLKPTDYVKEIEEALVEKDFQQANQLLREMKNNAIFQKDESIFNHETDYPVYVECVNKVIQAEISFLINEGDQQSSDRLIALINEYPIESNPAIGTTHDSDIIEGNDKYNAEVGKFNDYCNQILSRAISTNNQYLAEAIVNNFKPTLERKKVDTHFLGNDEYDYQYVETDKEKAKKILKEAIKEGKFNNQD